MSRIFKIEFGKRVEASVAGVTTGAGEKFLASSSCDNYNTEASTHGPSRCCCCVINNDDKIKKGTLMWITAKLNNQNLPVMIDTGATPSCIAQRCVEASSNLNYLPRQTYAGPGITAADGNILQPLYVLKVDVVLGQPGISRRVEVLVIKDLPYSCIFGQNILQTFDSWKINNVNKTMYIGQSALPFSHVPDLGHEVSLFCSEKTLIKSKQTTEITARANGQALSAFRPLSNITVLTESNKLFTQRLHIDILNSLSPLSHQNCKVKLTIHNETDRNQIIKKGAKIAFGHFNYDDEIIPLHEFFSEENDEVINTLNNCTVSKPKVNPIQIMTSHMTHLLPSELKEATSLLEEFSDIFSTGNDKIGKTTVNNFDIDITRISPTAVPLRRVPLQHRAIVKELIDRYLELGLVKPIDSPYRAATVLVKKKDLPSCTDITDRYRLCTDYRVLNRILPSSGWPAPSLQECLDDASDSLYFSSIDFNSGYYQIPCTSQAEEALAFSPGYGFPQYTWTVMPQGIKNASGCFQRTMNITFQGLENKILPPYFDDVTIKGRTFSEHKSNVRDVLKAVRNAGFTLNALKCKFFQLEVSYLGHLISSHAIRIDPKRISVIQNFPQPTCPTELRRFIGTHSFATVTSRI